MCSSTPYRWPIYSNDSIMEFSNREFSFMETSFPEIFCQGFFFHGKFFSWNFPFHEIKIFPGIFLIMENSFHGICFHSIFFLKFSFMEKKFMENSCSRTYLQLWNFFSMHGKKFPCMEKKIPYMEKKFHAWKF